MHTRIIVLVAILAGCSSPPDDTSPLATPTSTTSPPTIPEAPDVPPDQAANTTATLHFREFPLLAPDAPTAASPKEFTAPSVMDTLATLTVGVFTGQIPETAWMFTVPNELERVVGNGSVWVQAEGTMVNEPQGPACFWRMSIQFSVPRSAPNEPYPSVGACMGYEPTQVPPGRRQLHFAFELGERIPAGTEAHATFYAGIYPRPPTGTASILYDAVDYDSQFTLQTMDYPLTPP